MNADLTILSHQQSVPFPEQALAPIITRDSMDVAGAALQLLQAGQFAAARARLRSLGFKRGAAPEGYLLFMMVAYAKEEKVRMALRYARQVLTLNPDCVVAKTTAADMLARLGSLGEASILARQVISDHPRESAPWVTLAVVASRRGSREEAVTHVRKALELEPDSQVALLMLSIFLFTLERHEEAIPSLRRMLKRYPEHYEARFMLGLAQHYSYDHTAAIRSLRRALTAEALDEDSRIASLIHITSAYLALGNLKRYGEYVVALSSRYGYDPEVQAVVEMMEEEAAELRAAAADPNVRRLEGVYKALTKLMPMVDEVHALNDQVVRIWDEVAAVMAKIRARPVNNRVMAALTAHDQTLHDAGRVEKELATMFEALDSLVDSAAELSSDFTPARLREHLSSLHQRLQRDAELAGRILSAVNDVFAFQTQQLGH